MKMAKKILVVVDVQNDFVYGSLGSDEAVAVVPNIVKKVNEYRNKIINIHPSLIPAFCGKGYYGEKVHQGVIDYGAKVTGATVHFVDEGADTGPILLMPVLHPMHF